MSHKLDLEFDSLLVALVTWLRGLRHGFQPFSLQIGWEKFECRIKAQQGFLQTCTNPLRLEILNVKHLLQLTVNNDETMSVVFSPEHMQQKPCLLFLQLVLARFMSTQSCSNFNHSCALLILLTIDTIKPTFP